VPQNVLNIVLLSMNLDMPKSVTCTNSMVLLSLIIVNAMPLYPHTRAHSFPQAAEFRAEPRNLSISAEFPNFRGIVCSLVINYGCNYQSFTFWRAAEDRLPKLAALAKAYVALPVSSIDIQRSFSKYGSVRSPPCQSLSSDSLEAYCSVFCNQSIDCLMITD